MAGWARIGAADDAPTIGRGWTYETTNGDVAVFNVDGELFAIDGECPHQGAPLGMGQLSGSVVTCPGHGLRYDVITGLKPGSDRGVKTYRLQVRSDGLYLDIGPAAGDPAESGERQ